MSKIKICEKCGWVHRSDAVRATSYFSKVSPKTYRPTYPNAPVFSTREEAMEAMCNYWKETIGSHTEVNDGN